MWRTPILCTPPFPPLIEPSDHLQVVLSSILMQQDELRSTSRPLNGLTRTATFTEDMVDSRYAEAEDI